MAANLASTRKEYQNRFIRYIFSVFFIFHIFLAFLPLSPLLHPQSSSPSIPPHLASYLSEGNRLNEGNPTTSLSFFQKSECRRELNDLLSRQKEKGRRVSWGSDANCLVTLSVFLCTKCYQWRWGVSYSVWESSHFTWGVCVNAGNRWSLICVCVCVCACVCMCVCVCVRGVLWLIKGVVSDYGLI